MSAGASDSTQPTAPPEAVQIRARPPSPKRLSRKVLLAGALTIGGIVAFALLAGLSGRPDRRTATRSEEAPAASASLPESVRLLPTRYTAETVDGHRGEPDDDDEPRDMFWGERGPPDGWDDPNNETELEPPRDEFWAGDETRAASGAAHVDSVATAQGGPEIAPIFFDAGRRHSPAAAGTAPGVQAGIEGGGRRESFLSRQKQSDGRLDASYVAPRSEFTIQAGAVIPAALVTGLNSDLPGRVIAQVTAPVYDSARGDHLLIPQGARLIGTYDSATAHGDKRLLLAWNRLIMPNGWSIELGGMEATDPTGAAGLADKTDNHLGRLAGAIGLSAVLSIVGNEAEDGGEGLRFRQSIGDAAAQEAARVGGRLVDRELNLRPTLRVRPGAPVRVLVTRDIELKPVAETGP